MSSAPLDDAAKADATSECCSGSWRRRAGISANAADSHQWMVLCTIAQRLTGHGFDDVLGLGKPDHKDHVHPGLVPQGRVPVPEMACNDWKLQLSDCGAGKG